MTNPNFDQEAFKRGGKQLTDTERRALKRAKVLKRLADARATGGKTLTANERRLLEQQEE